MTAALLERPAIVLDGCRFRNWCDGRCEYTSHLCGERNHWSFYDRVFWAYDVEERISVQLYGYENDDDGVDPVRVYLAVGDDGLDEAGITLPADGARALGAALQGFTPTRPTYEDVLIHAVETDGDKRAVTAEFRRERWRRDAEAPQEEHVEFSIRPDSTGCHSIRVRLSLEDSQAFGARLVEEADRAAESNRSQGLVTT
jgi:hypothetical protein